MGEPADKISPTVMAAAKQRIGDVLNDVASRSSIQVDHQLTDGLGAVLSDARSVLPEAETGPLYNQVRNITDTVSDEQISGASYQALTRKGAPLDRAMNSADPNVKFYAGRIKDALDDALERSASPETLAQLRQARSQYRNMMTIAPLAEKSTTGDVSPAGLMQAVRSNSSNMAFGGGGQLGDLARIGQKSLKEPPQSGTAPREAVANAMAKVGAMGAAASGLEKASPYVSQEMLIPSLASAAGTYVAGRAASQVLRSPTVANLLISARHSAAGQSATGRPLGWRAHGRRAGR